ncbi:MAG: molybdenum cofactor guanylyltransferase [Polyangiales bacterium]
MIKKARSTGVGASVGAILVGGRSTRMGKPKGRIEIAGESLIARAVRVCEEADLEAVFVGESRSYDGLLETVPRIEDVPLGAGPLGGLHGALRYASGRGVVLLAVDMPYVTAAVLNKVCDTASATSADVLAARRNDALGWEPMLAFYESSRVIRAVDDALADGVRWFQRLFERLNVRELLRTDELDRALTDWDTPDDIEL